MCLTISRWDGPPSDCGEAAFGLRPRSCRFPQRQPAGAQSDSFAVAVQKRGALEEIPGTAEVRVLCAPQGLLPRRHKGSGWN